MVAVLAPKVAEPALHDHDFPLLGEVLALPELAMLIASPVNWGWGVVRGDGEPIINAPGFLGWDLLMGPLFDWQRRMGYKPFVSGLGWNADCPEDSEQILIAKVRRVFQETHKAVVLVGHSWGGTISERTARLIPEGIIKLVITLGSPSNPKLRINPLLDRARELNRRHIVQTARQHEACYTPECGCPFIRSLSENGDKGFRLVNIVARGDPVVHEEDTVHPDADRVVHVAGTHTGLPWNPEVYRVIADELAN